MDYNYLLDWCLRHWQLIITCLLSLINIVICLTKRKVVLSDTALTSVFSLIPSWIVDAEKQYGPGNGDKKLTYVLDVALHYICETTGYKETDVVRAYGSLISSFIESVLTTPSKK